MTIRPSRHGEVDSGFRVRVENEGEKTWGGFLGEVTVTCVESSREISVKLEVSRKQKPSSFH